MLIHICTCICPSISLFYFAPVRSLFGIVTLCLKLHIDIFLSSSRSIVHDPDDVFWFCWCCRAGGLRYMMDPRPCPLSVPVPSVVSPPVMVSLSMTMHFHIVPFLTFICLLLLAFSEKLLYKTDFQLSL